MPAIQCAVGEELSVWGCVGLIVCLCARVCVRVYVCVCVSKRWILKACACLYSACCKELLGIGCMLPFLGRIYSSVFNNDAVGTGHARSTLDSPQAWSAKTNDADQWMILDLGSTQTVRGVTTQGRADQQQWVTSYEIHACSTPTVCGASLGTFQGNQDQSTKRYQALPTPVDTPYLKIVPVTWWNHISMRAGVTDPPSGGAPLIFSIL